MKDLLQGAVIAFALYSKIPMPNILWQKNNMRYALCFLPLVGLAIGAVQGAWLYFADLQSIQTNLVAAVAVFIPLWISGGIHLDGFCDTIDALSSHQSQDKKLEIMQDPHVGAFALIWCGVYLLLLFGLWSALAEGSQIYVVIILSYAIARAYAASCLVKTECAKKEGLAAAFSVSADKKRVYGSLCLMLWLALLICLWADWQATVIIIIFLLGFHFYFKQMVIREFGGISGDLAGFAVEMVQLLILVALWISEVIW